MGCQFLHAPKKYLSDLGESIRVCANDCDIAWLWMFIVFGNVLLDGKIKDILLCVCRGEGIFTDVRAW